MFFNEDGAIQPVRPDEHGVGFLGAAPSEKINLAATAKVTASSYRPAKKAKGKIAPSEDLRIINKDSATIQVEREFTYLPGNAIDQSYGTRWRALEEDKDPWISFDLGSVRQITSCEMYFVLPALGTAWTLERSTDGHKWTVCSQQQDPTARSPHIAQHIGAARFLRLRITKGEPGLWEMKIF
jgi:hypothetical protein